MVFTCNRIPFVCNSWIYELLHNKMELPLVPMGGTSRGPQACHRDRSPLRLGHRECSLRPPVLGTPWFQSLGFGVLRGGEISLGQANFLPGVNHFDFVSLWDPSSQCFHSVGMSLLDRTTQIIASVSQSPLLPSFSSPCLWTQE